VRGSRKRGREGKEGEVERPKKMGRNKETEGMGREKGWSG